MKRNHPNTLLKHLLTLAGVFYCFCVNVIGKENEIIASFESPESTEIWRSVNDNVMGGVSRGDFTRTKQGTLRFKGSLSLQNGGGFASIRTLPREMNLGGATGIVVKARGDGRTYRVQLRTDRTDNRIATSYRANLPTVKGKFNEVLIPFSDFKLQSFGTINPNGTPVDPAAINSIGFSIADKKAGPFEFELKSVSAYQGEIKPPSRIETYQPDQSEGFVQKASPMDNALTIVSYQEPLPAKLAVMVEMDGPARMLNSSPSVTPKIIFNQSGSANSKTDHVYVQQGPIITVYDIDGREQRSFEIPSEIKFYLSFYILTDGRIAFFDNEVDVVYFTDKNGQYLQTVSLGVGRNSRLQVMRGIQVGDKLIISQNGFNELMSIDLNSYEISLFRSLKQLDGWLGAIAYSDGTYYLCQSQDIYSFTSNSDELQKLATTPTGNITQVIEQNGKLLVATNGRATRPARKGALYSIDLKDGKISEIRNADKNPTSLILLKPKNIEESYIQKLRTPVKVTNGNDSLAIVSYDPPLPAKFKVGDRLSVFIDYTIGSVDRAQIFARPYTKGKKTPGYTAHGSNYYKKGSREFVGWFEFRRPATVDEVRVRMVANRTDEVISVSEKVQADWGK